ncbi:MAG: exosome complex protein Rrp42, partial [Candidatus Woesearchaeota archaeon]
KNIRFDGRKNDEFRPITIQYGASSTAEGSTRVQFGDCEVIAGVKLGRGKPFDDRPKEGVLMVNAEMLPLSNPKYEGGQPGNDAIELSRVIDRGVRESHMIDNEKLCIKEGEKVWMVSVDISPINSDGELFDIAAFATVAAIKDAVYPEIVDDKVDYHKKTNTHLPIQRVPVSITIYKFGNNYVVDPSEREIGAADARLTLAFTEEDEIVAMQKGGETPFDINEVDTIIALAKKKSRELRALLK